jgi:hypothetical protein
VGGKLSAEVTLFGNTFVREEYGSEEAEIELFAEAPLPESSGLRRRPGEAGNLEETNQSQPSDEI